MLKSLAIIPDGNRRYAKKKNLSLEDVYKKSINKIFEIVRWCKEYNIWVLTVWGFSTENWKRSKTEKEILFRLFEKKAEEFLSDKKINEEEVRIKILGDISKFSKKLQRLFRKIETKTKNNKKYILNILLNYGGRKELTNAVNEILSAKKKKIGEREFKKFLWLQEEPDLIIRTSGEMRLSGFLPYQSAYSELYFTKKYFPELTKSDFKKIIENFNKRKRRFGR